MMFYFNLKENLKKTKRFNHQKKKKPVSNVIFTFSDQIVIIYNNHGRFH